MFQWNLGNLLEMSKTHIIHLSVEDSCYGCMYHIFGPRFLSYLGHVSDIKVRLFLRLVQRQGGNEYFPGISSRLNQYSLIGIPSFIVK